MWTLKGLISCLIVLWSITVFMFCFCASVVQITDLRCKVKINSDFFVSLFGMFSEVVFHHCFRHFIYLQDLKFYQRKGHICYCFRITEFISRM